MSIASPILFMVVQVTDLQSIISANIDLILEEQGISQAELARKIGMKPQQLNPYLTGAVKMPVSVLDAIKEGLGVGLERLFGSPPVVTNFRKPTESQLAAVVIEKFDIDPKRKDICLLTLTASPEDVEFIHNTLSGYVERMKCGAANHKKPAVR